MIHYDTKFDPPAMVIPVLVAGVVHRRPQVELSAVIDTGADVTAVPETCVDRLKLYPFGRLQLDEARLAWLDKPTIKMEVVLTPYPFVILGRDWLQDYYLLLDGPGQQFHLTSDRDSVNSLFG
jgi:hypothetical protein